MILIDTHTHLYLSEFKDDIADVLERAHLNGVAQFYLPGIDSSVIADMMALEAAYPGKCFAMMGLHPCSVKENYEEELRIVEEWLEKRKFAAVGEIGLDFYWDRTFEKEQHLAFERQITLAKKYQLPIVIHSRNSTQECIQKIKAAQDGSLKGIFHCFSGSLELAKEIIKVGFSVGIGGVLTYKNAGLAEVLASIDLEHMVLETDAPYLTPVPFRGKRNESSYLSYVVEKLAAVKNTTIQSVADITTANAQKIFGT